MLFYNHPEFFFNVGSMFLLNKAKSNQEIYSYKCKIIWGREQIRLSFPYSCIHSILFLEALPCNGQYRCQDCRDGSFSCFSRWPHSQGEGQTWLRPQWYEMTVMSHVWSMPWGYFTAQRPRFEGCPQIDEEDWIKGGNQGTLAILCPCKYCYLIRAMLL